MPEEGKKQEAKRKRRKRGWDIGSSTTGTPDETVQAKLAAAAQIKNRINALLQSKGLELPKGKKDRHEKEIDINNSENRFLLTKRGTHEDIQQKSGATVTVRGRYIAPGETPQIGERPLHLYVSAEIGRAVQQECRDRSRMPSSA
eukprot:TRINITY_DN4922_c0_g1_i3.p1 TRINITY_DN4922_c0_g1~~TRINITY_DN4922_c0_g1_i3.p1  ORF type:complete len:145 (-),score=30.26 TRINITY_DN4922_c0_g1_i3:10-444(-)